MKPMLTKKELNLVAIYYRPTRFDTLVRLVQALDEHTNDPTLRVFFDADLHDLMRRCIAKLSHMSNSEFDALDISAAVTD